MGSSRKQLVIRERMEMSFAHRLIGVEDGWSEPIRILEWEAAYRCAGEIEYNSQGEIYVQHHAWRSDMGHPWNGDTPRFTHESVESLTDFLIANHAPMWRYKVERYRDPNWREREASRLASGEYDNLPQAWCDKLDRIQDHYAHISVENGAMIAFTPDETKGELDIQVRIKPGRYLTKFYPELDGDTVRELACAVDKATAVQFAYTADDIERVYLNGPDSCMSKDPDDYESEFHPVRVYGSVIKKRSEWRDGERVQLDPVEVKPDTAIAYLGTLDKVSARAIVWPDKKRYGRVYGDEHRLIPALEAEGYTGGTMRGARIRRVEQGDAFVCPYLDSVGNVEDDGEWLIIGGDIDAQQTNGLTDGRDGGAWCEGCETSEHDEDDMRPVYLNASRTRMEYWCGHCAERDAFYCEGTQEYYCDEVDSVTIDYCTYTRAYVEDNGYYCELSEEWFLDDDMVTSEDTSKTANRDAAVDAGWYECEGEWYEDRKEAPDWYEPGSDEEADAIAQAFVEGRAYVAPYNVDDVEWTPPLIQRIDVAHAEIERLCPNPIDRLIAELDRVATGLAA